jgi:hypothetical protein
MLVRFKSDVGGFVMFGDVAKQLLRMCGHSGTVPGAIPADGVAAALASLESALARLPPDKEDKPTPKGGDAEQPEPAVPLRRRAFPLVELMQRAVTEECGIHWDTP